MINEDYVSFETAKLLKEKGFDEPCECFYDTENNDTSIVNGWMNISNSELEEREFVCYSAPTLQRTMKWLREVHNILVVIDYNYECTSKSYCYKIYHLDKNGKPKKFPVYGIRYDDEGNEYKDIISYRDFQLSYSDYTTYEDATEAAIYYCLEYLI